MWMIIIGIVLYLFSLASVWFFGWMKGIGDMEAEARDGWITVDGVQCRVLRWRLMAQSHIKHHTSNIPYLTSTCATIALRVRGSGSDC